MEAWIDMHCDTLSKLLYMEKEKYSLGMTEGQGAERGSRMTGGQSAERGSRIIDGQSAECGSDMPAGTLHDNALCVDLTRLKAAGAAAQFFACYVNAAKFGFDWDKAYENVNEMISLACREEGADFLIARRYDDLERAKAERKIAGLLTVEEGGVLNGEAERIFQLYERGVRLITLTWNYENCIGSPNSDVSSVMERGLTPFGFHIIERMNELGMIVDVSHLSDGGFYDCVRHSRTPVVASHSNARALCPHRRNLTDDMLRTLGETGGVIGVNLYSPFLCSGRRACVKDVARHVLYMINQAGEEAVALGTDFDGFNRQDSPAGLESVSDMEKLWSELTKAGLSERQMDRIRWENVNRLLKDVLK